MRRETGGCNHVGELSSALSVRGMSPVKLRGISGTNCGERGAIRSGGRGGRRRFAAAAREMRFDTAELIGDRAWIAGSSTRSITEPALPP
jgi:hypothetical protein